MKVPAVDLLRQPRSQGLSSYRPIVRAPRGGKIREPGNDVAFEDENLKRQPAVQALFCSGTLDNKSGFRCRHLGCLTGRGLVQVGVTAYSLEKYFLAPILHSYQIQDGGLIRKFALASPKYACTVGYQEISTHFFNPKMFDKHPRAF